MLPASQAMFQPVSGTLRMRLETYSGYWRPFDNPHVIEILCLDIHDLAPKLLLVSTIQV